MSKQRLCHLNNNELRPPAGECNSVVIRWSFDGHSMVIQWSFNGHSIVIRLLRPPNPSTGGEGGSFNCHSIVVESIENRKLEEIKC
jgi:hypothetical protein